jgi:hypothetical protein
MLRGLQATFDGCWVLDDAIGKRFHNHSNRGQGCAQIVTDPGDQFAT